MRITVSKLRQIIRETAYYYDENRIRRVDHYTNAVYGTIEILAELEEDVYDEWHTVEKDVRKLCREMGQPFDKVWAEALEGFGIELE